MTLDAETPYNGWKVASVPRHEAVPWIVDRHYAHRMPPISTLGGLVDPTGWLRGVCAFGPPARMFNDGYGLFEGDEPVPTFELNRLVIDDDCDPPLSWFVAKSLELLPRPAAVISYADPNAGHHGYIYQALSWDYLGTTADRAKFLRVDGTELHERTVVSQFGSSRRETLPKGVSVAEQAGKYRYLKLLGSKSQRRWLRRRLRYDVLPYPKGDNDRYEPAAVGSQGSLL